jgi:hypothetical protein
MDLDQNYIILATFIGGHNSKRYLDPLSDFRDEINKQTKISSSFTYSL